MSAEGPGRRVEEGRGGMHVRTALITVVLAAAGSAGAADCSSNVRIWSGHDYPAVSSYGPSWFSDWRGAGCGAGLDAQFVDPVANGVRVGYIGDLGVPALEATLGGTGIQPVAVTLERTIFTVLVDPEDGLGREHVEYITPEPVRLGVRARGAWSLTASVTLPGGATESVTYRSAV